MFVCRQRSRQFRQCSEDQPWGWESVLDEAEAATAELVDWG